MDEPMESIAIVRDKDRILLSELKHGASFSRKGSAKMQYALEARIKYADMLLGDV